MCGQVLQRRVTDMLSQGSEQAVCVVALCGEEVNVRSSRRFDQVLTYADSTYTHTMGRGANAAVEARGRGGGR